MDKNEFISLVLPLKDRLFRVAWCILRSKEEAEDIVQDVMLKVWRDEKGKVENLAAYCYTMARNKFTFTCSSVTCKVFAISR